VVVVLVVVPVTAHTQIIRSPCDTSERSPRQPGEKFGHSSLIRGWR
jgi:heme exporter protein D